MSENVRQDDPARAMIIAPSIQFSPRSESATVAAQEATITQLRLEIAELRAELARLKTEFRLKLGD